MPATSTISPRNHRNRSITWTPWSRSSPPPERSGTMRHSFSYPSRPPCPYRQRTKRSSPTHPSLTRARAFLIAGLCRLLKPTFNFLPLLRTEETISSAERKFTPMGFSQRTCFPWHSAATEMGVSHSFVVATTTRSTSLLLITSFQAVVAVQPVSAETFSARFKLWSAAMTMRQSGCFKATEARITPIFPHPTTPTPKEPLVISSSSPDPWVQSAARCKGRCSGFQANAGRNHSNCPRPR